MEHAASPVSALADTFPNRALRLNVFRVTYRLATYQPDSARLRRPQLYIVLTGARLDEGRARGDDSVACTDVACHPAVLRRRRADDRARRNGARDVDPGSGTAPRPHGPRLADR